MDFQIWDRVVHCAYGLGQVLAIEERSYNNSTILYYMISVADLIVWVPADDNLKNRLRHPSGAKEFRKSLSILEGPAQPLPQDRRQRTLQLQEILKDGRVESLCRVIRDLGAHRTDRNWNEHDQALMKRVQNALIGEWSFILSITSMEAEVELRRLLSHRAG